MKKTLYIFFLLIGFIGFAQSGPNPFEEGHSDNTFNKVNTTKDNETQAKDNTAFDTGGGNPGDPTPIDNYIPLLLLTAVGILVYYTRQKKQLHAGNKPDPS